MKKRHDKNVVEIATDKEWTIGYIDGMAYRWAWPSYGMSDYDEIQECTGDEMIVCTNGYEWHLENGKWVSGQR